PPAEDAKTGLVDDLADCAWQLSIPVRLPELERLIEIRIFSLLASSTKTNTFFEIKRICNVYFQIRQSSLYLFAAEVLLCRSDLPGSKLHFPPRLLLQHLELATEYLEFATDHLGCQSECALDFWQNNIGWVVVTLGPNGCIAKHGKEIVRVPAIGEAKAIDATGAEELFASGFLYRLVNGLNLEECCKVGLCNGGSVIRALGGEVTPENWQWMHKQMQTKGLTVPSSEGSLIGSFDVHGWHPLDAN
ncbi:putative sugar kinase YdjH, partial [Camellia lanceoleosa]